ncbi:hypothetical protein [Methylomonas rapida]|uniref:Uncharacterized protein n=1 Tax=Methylomonas rapida TaxID=2963939 RepID=A0ABY7GGI2_9GAMM|nr:hypothetical protein [Methylomonas rapida]WAR43346.1 hypothetical protein NM686_013210 [Methylomonas rapida]
MILVLSGEGPTDFGACSNALGRCSGEDITLGPLTVLVDQMITMLKGHSVLDNRESLYYRSEAFLREKAKTLPGRLQPARSKKKEAETGYFFGNAIALGVIAKELETQSGQQAIAILHRDCDSTRSAHAGAWENKRKSMVDGFKFSQFSRGVPCLPKPTSEVWWLCAAKPQHYQSCAQLEELPGNVESANHPKKKLDDAFGEHKSADGLCDWLAESPFDINRAAAMPSFKSFKDDLKLALDDLTT